MGTELCWTGPNPFAKYWERRQCKLRAAGWRLDGGCEQVWWRGRRKLAKVRVESMRGFEQYRLLVVSFLCPWHFFTSQTGKIFGRHKKDTRTSLQKHCQKHRTLDIDYFDPMKTFSSKQKLQKALESWSNFSLLLFGKGRKIQRLISF